MFAVLRALLEPRKGLKVRTLGYICLRHMGCENEIKLR